MEGLEVVIVAAICSITGLVGIAIYLNNSRAVEQLRQDNLNYRASMKAGSYPSGQVSQEPDGMSQIINLVMQHPEILQKLGLGGNNPPTEEKQQF